MKTKKHILYFIFFFNFTFAQEFYKADSLFQIRNYDKALALYMKSNNDYKFYKIAKFYENQDDFISAKSNYLTYLSKFPNDNNGFYEYAKLLYENKYIDNAVEILKTIVIKEENTMFYYYLGLCYEKKNDLLLTKEYFVKASKTDSYHLKSNYKAAFYLALENKFDEAETIIKRILAKNKNKTDFILLKAQIHYTKKEFKEALENYQLMIKLYEKERFIYEKVARCYTELKEYQKAIDSWKEIIKIYDDEGNPDIERNLAANYAYLKNVKQADFHYNNAIKLSTFTFETEYFALARLYRDNANIPKAIYYLEKTIKEKKDYAPAHYELLILTENKYSNKELLVKYEKLHLTYQKDFDKNVNDYLIQKIEELRKKVFMNP